MTSSRPPAEQTTPAKMRLGGPVPTIGDGTVAMGLPKSIVIVSLTLPPAPSQCVLDATLLKTVGFLKAAKALSQKRDNEQRPHHKQNNDVCQCEPCAALRLSGKVVSFKGGHSDRGPPRAQERSARQPPPISARPHSRDYGSVEGCHVKQRPMTSDGESFASGLKGASHPVGAPLRLAGATKSSRSPLPDRSTTAS